jgi:ABC-type antimicrobial peptide transport system permease subunit
MRLSDLFSLSLSNLWRRKLRTFLTVLGVLIGTASIVVMVSIGVGQSDAMMKQIGSSQTLRQISIYGYNDKDSGISQDQVYPGAYMGSGTGLTDEKIAELESFPEVERVIPKLSSQVRFSQGGAVGDLQIIALPEDYIESLDLKFVKGEWPIRQTSNPISILVSDSFPDQFWFENGEPYRGGDLSEQEPIVDMYGKNFFAIFDVEAYFQSQGDPAVQKPKKYLIQVDGVFSQDDVNRRGLYEYGYNVLTDIDSYKNFMQQVFKGKAWPGQPADKNGKATGALQYSSFIVETRDLKDTENLTNTLRDMGYQASSEIEFIRSMQEQSRTVQLVLGGIGGVSLLVAAIGIANTMMMSIYERTKEIGIYKVLGCKLQNIGALFLLESGFIGLFGGLLGLGISYGLSYLMNYVAGLYINDMESMSYRLSLIPPWLSLGALAFSILIGVLSGLMPALRAMRLSPL